MVKPLSAYLFHATYLHFHSHSLCIWLPMFTSPLTILLSLLSICISPRHIALFLPPSILASFMTVNFGRVVAPSPWDKGVTREFYIIWPARFWLHISCQNFKELLFKLIAPRNSMQHCELSYYIVNEVNNWSEAQCDDGEIRMTCLTIIYF